MRAAYVVVPDGIDDPARPSGGNTYDRHACRELGSLGWSVHEHPVSGRWPRADTESLAALARIIRRIPDGAAVLLDGLIASTAPEVLVPRVGRLHVVVLVHMPLGHRPAEDAASAVREREGAVLSAAAAVVTTSAWSRRRLLELYRLAPDRVVVAEPGVVAGDLAAGSPAGDELLCVAAVSFEKGHDVLLDALARTSELPWRCVCVGSLERDPGFFEAVRNQSASSGLAGRVSFAGPLTRDDLDRRYGAADLLVLASRAETYGMVVTEALARGVPVLAADVGGLSEALGHGADGTRPGLLVAPEDPVALGAALRRWLSEPELRGKLRRAARERRKSLPTWARTASILAAVLQAAPR